jgi:TolB-like protein
MNDTTSLTLLPECAAQASEVGADIHVTRRKKDKVRSAWISFAGRIVAQMVGAAATVVLGLAVVQQYAARSAAGGGKAAVAAEAATTSASPRTRSVPGVVAIAVLPIEDFSVDPGQQHLADGLTEAIIADLAQTSGVRVISRTSSMQFRGQRKPLTAIARELDVDLVVEGSLVRNGRRVRVTAQLIDGRSDEHVWARSYDHALDDLLDAQAVVANEIAEQLLESLPPRNAM